jgi:hypothetical protein
VHLDVLGVRTIDLGLGAEDEAADTVARDEMGDRTTDGDDGSDGVTADDCSDNPEEKAVREGAGGRRGREEEIGARKGEGKEGREKPAVDDEPFSALGGNQGPKACFQSVGLRPTASVLVYIHAQTYAAPDGTRKGVSFLKSFL